MVANEPRLYRELTAWSVRTLRPDLHVVERPPAGLARTISEFQPHIVVSGHVPTTVAGPLRAWITLYPQGESVAVVQTESGWQGLQDIRFADILSLIDTAAVPPAVG